jgi:hypothetical protein
MSGLDGSQSRMSHLGGVQPLAHGQRQVTVPVAPMAWALVPPAILVLSLPSTVHKAAC